RPLDQLHGNRQLRPGDASGCRWPGCLDRVESTLTGHRTYDTEAGPLCVSRAIIAPSPMCVLPLHITTCGSDTRETLARGGPTTGCSGRRRKPGAPPLIRVFDGR